MALQNCGSYTQKRATTYTLSYHTNSKKTLPWQMGRCIMPLKFTNAFFITAALATDSFPTIVNIHGQPLEEIAFLGRSNVGKSSLINHLLQKPKLAKVSATPGKTQTLNFFNVDNQICLVDLPGYGFAKVPKALKKEWAVSIDTYLKMRTSLKLFILLLDCRRIPSQEDIDCLLWANFYKKPLIIVFTKSDKLRAKERKPQKEKLLNILHTAVGRNDLTTLSYSTKNLHMRQVLINTINNVLNLNTSETTL